MQKCIPAFPTLENLYTLGVTHQSIDVQVNVNWRFLFTPPPLLLNVNLKSIFFSHEQEENMSIL